MVRDVGSAEDLAQDALVAALEQWPHSGFPVNPGAWLMAVAKRRAIDGFRREELRERKQEEFGLALRVRADESTAPFDAALEDEISDDLLRLRRRGSSPWLAVCLSRSTSCRSRSAPKSHLRPIGICRPIRLREAVIIWNAKVALIPGAESVRIARS